MGKRVRTIMMLSVAVTLAAGCLEDVTVGLDRPALVQTDGSVGEPSDAAVAMDGSVHDAGLLDPVDAGPVTDAGPVDPGPCMPVDCQVIAITVQKEEGSALCPTGEALVCERNSQGMCERRCPEVPPELACNGLGVVMQCEANAFCRRQAGDCSGIAGACAELPTDCSTSDSNPVCGCDGITYDNACQAFAKGLNLQSLAACP